MHRRLLIITKEPEFDERGEVVLGQCEPFTSGWQLVLINSAGKREKLIAGTYTDLRRIQESCASLENPEAVRQRVREMRTLLNTSVTETVAVEFSAPEDQRGSTRILEPTKTSLLAVVPEKTPAGGGGEFFELREESGVLAALIADPDRAGDVAALKSHLQALLENKPRAIVLDFSRIQNLTSRVPNELVLFQEACAEANIHFGLCGLRKSVLRLLENLGHENLPPVYDSFEAALAKITPGK